MPEIFQKLEAAIDGIQIVNERMYLNGWAFAEKAGVRQPVDHFSCGFDGSLEVHRLHRRDFPEVGDFGFRVLVEDTRHLSAIFFDVTPLIACVGLKTVKVKIWNRLNNRILAILIQEKAERTSNAIPTELISAVMDSFPKITPTNSTTTSDFKIQEGSMSYDGTASIGKSGHLFLEGGTNNVRTLYSSVPSPGAAEKWRALIEHRAQAAASLGSAFLQLIIPEKQSIMPEYYSQEISTPTRLLASILKCRDNSKFLFNVQELFRSLFVNEGLEPFRRVDSHLSFLGAQHLSSLSICHITGISVDWGSPNLTVQRVSGDLGNKFLRGNIYEHTIYPESNSWALGNIAPKIIESHDPKQGHSGIMRKWVNEQPLIDKSILIFGNSMFERGTSPFGLSWWFSRAFRETTFYWSSTFDSKIAQQHSADYIICQTVERFISSIPNE